MTAPARPQGLRAGEGAEPGWREVFAVRRPGLVAAVVVSLAFATFGYAAVLLVVWCIPLTALTAPAWIWVLPNDRIDLGPLHLVGTTGALISVRARSSLRATNRWASDWTARVTSAILDSTSLRYSC